MAESTAVLIHRLWLSDFRNYERAELTFSPGLTVVVGGNGEGKTNLLEAIAYLALLESFRGAPREALVRVGAQTAVVRAEGERQGRTLLLEAELGCRDRVLVNRQPLRRARDLLGALRVTVFTPDDLALVQGGPAERRRFLDQLLVALVPRNDRLRADVERVLRQRNALLRQAGGRLDRQLAATLDVWDERLATLGEELASARCDLVRRLGPFVARAYEQLAGTPVPVTVEYVASWQGNLASALAAGRAEDVRRGMTLIGPHRDDLRICLFGRSSRTYASRGEQRCLALALRLGGHELLTDLVGSPPVLLLDDVFSELDPERAAALVAHLPAGQALVTTAGPLPAGLVAGSVVRVMGGRIDKITECPLTPVRTTV